MKFFAKTSLAACAMATAAMAQNMSFGADNFYVSDHVTVEPITFQSLFRNSITGNLYIRNNITLGNAPAIVISHPMGAVKEQSANLYATKMAEQGFVTLSLDLPHWGGSEGEPRNGVSPDYYAEAFSAAVDYLGTVDGVDRNRIGGIGICGSGSFILSAAKIDSRLRAIATVSMYDMGGLHRNGLRLARSLEQRREAVASVATQRWAEVDGAPTAYDVGTVLELTPESDPIAREFFDFYRTSRGEFTPEGSSPNITTMPMQVSNVKFQNFYPLSDLDAISPRPLLFISGDQAHSREYSEYAYAGAIEPKELVWVADAGHVDLYDRTELIPFAKLTDFFRENLAAGVAAENCNK
ncbi:putative alpha/beta superfamily hydrolase [Plectosphaerella plurivora]|uniref:Alpha/beta superfamily hydrolase n=1 Tax=Plectosphaerella plurivora TaxID=936078 RepID=A0A9P8V134_9PEZI|nr:putative alpha/beta superfamily hydrolase [Plectosphaerella plurivora]